MSNTPEATPNSTGKTPAPSPKAPGTKFFQKATGRIRELPKKQKLLWGGLSICILLGALAWLVYSFYPVQTKFVCIPAGSFTMGSPADELGRKKNETQHKVNITRPFMMQNTQVTQSQWENLMGYNPSRFKSCGPNCPVEQVNWHQALAYANALSDSKGLGRCFDCRGSGPKVTCKLKNQYNKPQDCPGYRLPTEAEWEYAARAGSTTGFHTGPITGEKTCHNMAKAGWYGNNSNKTTHPVGLKQPNNWGLYDMHGNVWEWTWDWHQEDLGSREVTDPYGPSTGSYRVHRGCSWRFHAEKCRAGYRDGEFITAYSIVLGTYDGFRLVRTL